MSRLTRRHSRKSVAPVRKETFLWLPRDQVSTAYTTPNSRPSSIPRTLLQQVVASRHTADADLVHPPLAKAVIAKHILHKLRRGSLHRRRFEMSAALQKQLAQTHAKLSQKRAELQTAKHLRDERVTELQQWRSRLSLKQLTCRLLQTELLRRRPPQPQELLEQVRMHAAIEQAMHHLPRRLLELQLTKEHKMHSELTNQLTLYTHWNTALTLKNVILGERLKGLFQSLRGLDTALCMDLLSAEMQQLHTMGWACLANSDSLLMPLRMFNDLNCLKAMDNTEVSFRHQALLNDIKQIKLKSKTKVDLLSMQLVGTTQDVQVKSRDLVKLDKKFEQLSLSYSKHQKELQGILVFQNRKHEEELHCIKCQKTFSSNTNSPIACQWHASQWSGTEYWCCGRKSVNAPGCNKTAHVSRGQFLAASAVQRCSSCREQGHAAVACPRDPNVRSKIDSAAELERLESISHRKYHKLLPFTEVPEGEESFEEDVSLLKSRAVQLTVYDWEE